MDYKNVRAVVLAAGKGKRLGSEETGIPKVMRGAAGRPLLSYVLRALNFLPPEDIVLVVGFMMEKVRSACGPSYRYAEQLRQLGTGHAAMCAMERLPGFRGTVLVCCGDMPLIRKSSYEALLEEHMQKNNACTLLSGESGDPTGYGRVLLDENGGFLRIAEERDCSPEERKVRLINSAIYAFDAEALLSALPRLETQNAQGEYYLTDVPGLLKAEGRPVGVLKTLRPNEAVGVNTVEQLNFVEELIRAEGLSF